MQNGYQPPEGTYYLGSPPTDGSYGNYNGYGGYNNQWPGGYPPGTDGEYGDYGTGGYGNYGGYGGYEDGNGYWSYVNGEYVYTYYGQVLDEVTVSASSPFAGTTASIRLTEASAIIPLRISGDQLIIDTYTTQVVGGQSGEYVNFNAVFGDTIGGEITVRNVTLSFNAMDRGLSIMFNDILGANYSIGLSSEGATGGISFTNNGTTIGQDYTYKPGMTTALVIVGGALFFITGGISALTSEAFQLAPAFGF